MGQETEQRRGWRFQRISQALRGRDWFGVGVEVFAVVLGVLLALQASQWATAQREEAERTALTERLIVDLERFAEDYELRAETRAGAIDSVERIAAHLAEDTTDSVPDEALIRDIENLRSFGDLRPLPLSYQEITQAGLIGRLAEQEDREALEALSRTVSQYQVMFGILLEAYPPSDPLYSDVVQTSILQTLASISNRTDPVDGTSVDREVLKSEEFERLIKGVAIRQAFQLSYDRSVARRAREAIEALEDN